MAEKSTMKGTIISFRRGRHKQKTTHILIEVGKTDNRGKAAKLVGKEASWKSPTGKIIKGRIEAPHGNKGVVRAIFEKGLPGQAIGQKVDVK